MFDDRGSRGTRQRSAPVRLRSRLQSIRSASSSTKISIESKLNCGVFSRWSIRRPGWRSQYQGDGVIRLLAGASADPRQPGPTDIRKCRQLDGNFVALHGQFTGRQQHQTRLAGIPWHGIAISRTGRRKARVLPLPVTAPLQMSRPCRAHGIVDAWIRVGRVKPSAVTPLRRGTGQAQIIKGHFSHFRFLQNSSWIIKIRATGIRGWGCSFRFTFTFIITLIFTLVFHFVFTVTFNLLFRLRLLRLAVLVIFFLCAISLIFSSNFSRRIIFSSILDDAERANALELLFAFQGQPDPRRNRNWTKNWNDFFSGGWRCVWFIRRFGLLCGVLFLDRNVMNLFPFIVTLVSDFFLFSIASITAAAETAKSLESLVFLQI